MTWMSTRRAQYHPRGPFIFKRTGEIGDLSVKFGQLVTAKELHDAGLDVRRIERLYSAYWMDMAPDDDVEAAELSAQLSAPADGAPAAAEGPQGTAGTQEPPSDPLPPTEPEHGDAVGARALGFGRYQREDANGVLFGPKLTKTEAEMAVLPPLPQVTVKKE